MWFECEAYTNETVEKIVSVMKDFDYYEFRDCYDTDADAFADVDRALRQNGAGVVVMLRDIFENTEDPDIEKEAAELIAALTIA